jgi:hypothetical protein
MAMELAYRLATNDTLQRYLEKEIVLIAPSMNPDGQRMITEWYRKNSGHEVGRRAAPWLYHPYVGHDNNRDWFMVTQKETRLVTDYLYGVWFPEIFYDVHQMGAEGARIFVPPLVDPVNPNLDPMIVRGIAHVGAEMALRARGARQERGGEQRDLRSVVAWWSALDADAPQHGRRHHGGRERSDRDADRPGYVEAARACAWAPEVRASHQLPEPVAGRHVAAARHHRLRARGRRRRSCGSRRSSAKTTCGTSWRWAGARSRRAQRKRRMPS